jgi:hypothetical protein
MLRVEYHGLQDQVLFNGRREDYDRLAASVKQVVATGTDAAMSVSNVGPVHVSGLLIRRGAPPNRISLTGECIVISVAPQLERQFLSFIQFPADRELPDGYHHHYDALGDDGANVAPDSLPVVFTLDKA